MWASWMGSGACLGVMAAIHLLLLTDIGSGRAVEMAGCVGE